MKILMINGSPHPRGGDVPGRQLRPVAGLRPTSPRGGHPVGLQEIHEHEAFGGSFGRHSIAGYFIQPEPANNFAHKS